MQEPEVGLRWQTMVDRLVQAYPFQNPAIEAAFRRVPRHAFLPGVPLEQVYDYAQAIPTRRGPRGEATSSSSAPDIMGLMLDMLDVQPGQRVLEIGAGTGYNAAILADMVGPTGRVVSIELQPEVAEDARQNLSAAGFDRVQVEIGDGGFGYPPAAPYDRIIVTACASAIPPAWREQLVEGGRLVLPLELFGMQHAVAFERRGVELAARARTGCGFMPLQGAFGRSFAAPVPLGARPGVFLMGYRDRDYAPEAAALWEWLSASAACHPSAVFAGREEILNRLIPWLWLRWPGDGASLWATEAAGDPPFPPLIAFGANVKAAFTYAFFSAGDGGLSAALLAAPPNSAPDSQPIELSVCPLGPAVQAAQDLLDLLTTWQSAGRPTIDWLTLRVFPTDLPSQPTPGETVLTTSWGHLFVQTH